MLLLWRDYDIMRYSHERATPIARDQSSKRWNDKAIDKLSRISSYILYTRAEGYAEYAGGGQRQ